MKVPPLITENGNPVVLRANDVWKSYDEGAIHVLRGVDFEAIKGQTVALCGPSGCGKSTLLHLLGGLDEPDRGRISVNNIEINRHRSSLNHRLNQRIQKLSGGERQRTALCRALMNQPKILLADEPTGSLDENSSATVFQLLLDLVATEGITLVMATHDRSLAERCDRIVEMRDGRIHEPQLV
jgi:lipoprotein-releasing system ATP-binding protein